MLFRHLTQCSDMTYLTNIITVLFLKILILLRITHTHTRLKMNREKQITVLRPVKDTYINTSHTCIYMIQKINKRLFPFVLSKSSKRTNTIHFKVLEPALQISSQGSPESLILVRTAMNQLLDSGCHSLIAN